MWNIPSKEKLSAIPKLYETDFIAARDKLIFLHFFIGSCDWYIAEYDGGDLFFGFAILNDQDNSEWGYISFSELKLISINGVEVDCELHWEVKRAEDIEKIKVCNNETSYQKTSEVDKI